ncbi:hypothetical protein LX64_04796 [Chitinophaga skermanii]|uniref:Uncharacterized protein n=1 Tax=Chitinophaga skermanii TaxID=331697 RepID=A0A327Q3E6_9BACT|nr:hypothetical protein [Chitinophaga skermanii]RAI98434.1 hypothetical protein LX64_04796 [Chitinophaga skermanii]
MKQLFSYILLTAIMLQTCSKGLIVLEFVVNKNYIENVLCVNRAKPQLACHGKCHFMKQMAKDTQQEKNGNSAKDKYEVVLQAVTYEEHTTNLPSTIIPYPAYSEHLVPAHVGAIFRPPCA